MHRGALDIALLAQEPGVDASNFASEVASERKRLLDRARRLDVAEPMATDAVTRGQSERARMRKLLATLRELDDAAFDARWQTLLQ